MKHIKGNPLKQHIKVEKGESITDRMNMSKQDYWQNMRAIPSGIADHMVVCNMFEQYKLTDSTYTVFGMCVPYKYSPDTYGRNCVTGEWFVLSVSGTYFKSGHACNRWDYIESNKVPKQFQAAALLLS